MPRQAKYASLLARECLGAVLEPHWSQLGSSWDVLDSHWMRLAGFGIVLGRFGCIWDRFWVGLDAFWVGLGCTSGPFWFANGSVNILGRQAGCQWIDRSIDRWRKSNTMD